MPVYEFRCQNAHLHECALPLSSDRREVPCPDCGGPARRMISAPGIHHLGSPAARALDASARSAHEPTVVDRPPAVARPGTPRNADPRHARLPRP